MELRAPVKLAGLFSSFHSISQLYFLSFTLFFLQTFLVGLLEAHIHYPAVEDDSLPWQCYRTFPGRTLNGNPESNVSFCREMWGEELSNDWQPHSNYMEECLQEKAGQANWICLLRDILPPSTTKWGTALHPESTRSLLTWEVTSR